jgi:aspartyl-tRNA(Asn)/glutamyl-tRNA(Gln) amidotransferase subunit A
MTALHDLGVVAAAEAIRSRQITATELVTALLQRIDALEHGLLAWVTIDRDGALAAAKRADEQVASGRPLGPLHGVPIGIKDLYLTRGMPTQAGFEPLRGFDPGLDAEPVARLKGAGAIILGKTVTTQFASADPSISRNPWHADRTPGGSSSGSAVSVAARMVPFAIGSQTGGSILRPAGYCGVVGIKPSFGLVSRRNVMPLAWTLDHVGPIARSVEDAAQTLEIIAGHDAEDAHSASRLSPRLLEAAREPRVPRLGLIEDALERAQPDVRSNCESVASTLAAAGATVVRTRLASSLDLHHAVHRVTMRAEQAGVHLWGINDHAERYQPRIRAEAMVGQLIPTPIYLHAQRLRRRLANQFNELVRGFDALLLPTASNVAPAPDTTGDMTFQSIASLLGTPSIALPSGVNADGLPFSTQLMAGRFDEARMISVAAWCERAIGFGARPPGM